MSDFLQDYDFQYPPELVAQRPLEERSASRMLVVDPVPGTWSHEKFTDLPEYLRPGDLLVANDTRVRPCRFYSRKATGGQVELLFLRECGDLEWEVLLSPARGLKVGQSLQIFRRSTGEAAPFAVEITSVNPEAFRVRFAGAEDQKAAFTQWGEMPLPPYIERKAPRPEDEKRYQTIFAKCTGAVAAPTAGLHFSDRLREQILERGVYWSTVTLHVGLGTFLPVRSERVSEHVMHREWYRVDEATREALEQCGRRGGRVVAVGTTALRALEAFAATGQSEGMTDLFIRPGYRTRCVQALLTNFHQPKSTLLMLVSALAGRSFILNAYEAAVAQRYRLFSYGDCMLIRRFQSY